MIPIPPKSPHVVIVGAGYAGLQMARRLQKKVPHLTLIDQHPYHTHLTSLHQVAGGALCEQAVRLELARLFQATAVQVIQGEMTQLNPHQSTLQVGEQTLSYDYLVLAQGARPHDYQVPGVGEYGFFLGSLSQAVRIRSHVQQQVFLALHEPSLAKRQALLTFVVVGSGFTGCEMVTELAQWIPELAVSHGLNPREIRCMLVEQGKDILTQLPANLLAKAKARLNKLGVRVLTHHQVTALHERELQFKHHPPLATHTVIWTAGVQANNTVPTSLPHGQQQRLLVNRQMQSVAHSQVYVLGDQGLFVDATGQTTPQTVENTEYTAKIAAKHLLAQLNHQPEPTPADPRFHGFMLSLGGDYGLAFLNGRCYQGRLAMIVKTLVSVVYFIRIGAWFHLKPYVTAQWFKGSPQRQVFGNLTTHWGNLLWSLPLRWFLGLFWLNQGLEKFFGPEHWRDATDGFIPLASWQDFTQALSQALATLSTGISDTSWLVTDFAKMPMPWLVDALTSPTPRSLPSQIAAYEAALAQRIDWGVPIFAEPLPLIEGLLWPLMPTVGVAVFMQQVMVFVQLGMGLGLLLGLFTFVSAGMSFALLVLLLFTAMLGWADAWAIVASLALLNGAGRSFGLDAKVLPWLTAKRFLS